jgi:DNA-directed RNA polymerase subunit RPC12/RpoP
MGVLVIMQLKKCEECNVIFGVTGGWVNSGTEYTINCPSCGNKFLTKDEKTEKPVRLTVVDSVVIDLKGNDKVKLEVIDGGFMDLWMTDNILVVECVFGSGEIFAMHQYFRPYVMYI